MGRSLAQESGKGDVIVVRYADDLVVGFQHRTDAERFLREFRERLAKFGLELHADKTRLIEFGRFAARDRKQRGEGKPETFTFLGFTHFCGQRSARRPSSSGGLRRRSGWSRSSKPSRLSFNVGSIIARPRSVHGFARLCWVTTNTMPFRVTRLSCASFTSRLLVVAERLVRRSQRAQVRWDRLSPVLTGGFPNPALCILILRLALPQTSKVGAVCVNALVRICAGGDQRWSSLPRQLARNGLRDHHSN